MIKEINKLIKPYIVHQKDGGCYIKMSLKEWDELLDEILFIILEKIGRALSDVKKMFRALFR